MASSSQQNSTTASSKSSSKVSFFFCLTLVIASFLVGVIVGQVTGLSFNTGSPITSKPQNVQTKFLEESYVVSQNGGKTEALPNPSGKNETHPIVGLARTRTRTPPNSTASWCPKAVCLNSDLCQPCQRRFLILLATGRSASTTLDFMLDSLPGVRMSGENNDELKAIKYMMDNIIKHSVFKDPKVPRKSPWGHNPVPQGATACVGQKMIETINPPLTDRWGTVLEDDTETIIGFKTVRFLHKVTTEADTIALVRWVQAQFPCAKFLVNIRSAEKDQAKSQAKAFIVGDELRTGANELHQLNERMRNLVKLFGGDQAYLLDSSEWTKNLESLNQAVEWLGFHKSCHFQELLEFNTGSGGYGAAKTQIELSPECHYVGGS
jgi:hypothetical protein